MSASAAASSPTIPVKSIGAASAPVSGPNPPLVSQRSAAPAPRVKLLSTRVQQPSCALRVSRARSRVGIVIAAS
jgi:hypothetical protein